MPMTTVTIIKALPAGYAAAEVPNAPDRAVNAVLHVDDAIAQRLVREGYAQFGSVGKAPHGNSSAVTVTLKVALPAGYATDTIPNAPDRLSGAVLKVSPELAGQLVRADYAKFGSAAQDVNDNSLGKGKRGASATLDFPSVAANGNARLTLPVKGAAVGDPVVVGAPATLPAGIGVLGFVSAAGVVTIQIINTTAAPVDLPSATWKAVAIKV